MDFGLPQKELTFLDHFKAYSNFQVTNCVQRTMLLACGVKSRVAGRIMPVKLNSNLEEHGRVRERNHFSIYSKHQFSVIYSRVSSRFGVEHLTTSLCAKRWGSIETA